MKRFSFFVAALFMLLTTYSQTSIDLTFTAINGADYAQLDSIRMMNRTQGGDTVLFYPDTVLSLVMTGINEFISKESGFHLFQNYPNPINDQSTVSLQIPTSGKLNNIITDILGRTVFKSDHELEKGTHSFRFTPGDGDIYFFTARYKNESRSIKMLCSPNRSGKHISINYLGNIDENTDLKASSHVQNFLFNYGDELLYIGYFDTLQSGMLDSPEESDIYIFQFAYDIPCPGAPTVEYEEQIYNTVQIMSQCWLKENLNVGSMIPDGHWQQDNDTIEKWCYNNEPDSCITYGGIYNWMEIINYSAIPGEQGICPPGWHPPTDEEWKILESVVDSKYGIGDPEWDNWYLRGYDGGYNLKTTIGWYNGINGNDIFGFSALPGGGWDEYGDFGGVGTSSGWWTGTGSIIPGNNFADTRQLLDSLQINRVDEWAGEGRSVRCIKDTSPSDYFTELSFSGIDNTSSVQLDSIKVMNRTHEGEMVLVYPDTTLTLDFDLPNYHSGDQLLLVGYYDTLESGILHTPVNDTLYKFQFAYDIPCPGTSTVEYEGRTYNTVQIMSQCWLKENLNVGTMIDGSEEMSNNDTIEKYCYNNEPDSCTKYGGLYMWSEMMHYNPSQGVQGICPSGWHIPTDEELKLLEGAVDSQYGIGDSEWDRNYVFRGFDAHEMLKARRGWNWADEDCYGKDRYGFSSLPGGRRTPSLFYGMSYYGCWLTYNYELQAYTHAINCKTPGVGRGTHIFNLDKHAFSVRCLKD